MICSSANWRTISVIACCSSVCSLKAAVSTAMAPSSSGRGRGAAAGIVQRRSGGEGYRRARVESGGRGGGLEQHLLDLLLGVGIDDDRAAGADRGAAPVEHYGADRDAQITGAAAPEPADRTRVDAARLALELI